MKMRNVFKIVNGKIEYADFIKEAVLNPRLGNLNIQLNGGWDWIDSKYGFIKLLLNRGQIDSVVTNSDLLARRDYLEAASIGLINKRGSVEFHFEAKPQTRKSAYASEKRMLAAQERFQAYRQELAQAQGGSRE